jgi:hypothetical protein
MVSSLGATVFWTGPVDAQAQVPRPDPQHVLGEHPPVIRVPDVPSLRDDEEDVAASRHDHLLERHLCFGHVLEEMEARHHVESLRLDRDVLPWPSLDGHLVRLADVAAGPPVGFNRRVTHPTVQEPRHEAADAAAHFQQGTSARKGRRIHLPERAGELERVGRVLGDAVVETPRGSSRAKIACPHTGPGAQT